MPVEVGERIAYPRPPEPCCGVALRVELDDLHPVRRDGNDERHVVLFRYRVRQRHMQLVLHELYVYGVLPLGWLDLKRRQRDPSARDDGPTYDGEHVAAHWTYIELGAKGVRGTISVAHVANLNLLTIQLTPSTPPSGGLRPPTSWPSRIPRGSNPPEPCAPSRNCVRTRYARTNLAWPRCPMARISNPWTGQSRARERAAASRPPYR